MRWDLIGKALSQISKWKNFDGSANGLPLYTYVSMYINSADKITYYYL